MANDGVTHLVVRHDLLLVGLEHPALLLEASHDPLDRLIEVALFHAGPLGACGQQRTFVDEVGQVSAGEATGGLGDPVEVHARGQLHLAGVDVEDGLAA